MLTYLCVPSFMTSNLSVVAALSYFVMTNLIIVNKIVFFCVGRNVSKNHIVELFLSHILSIICKSKFCIVFREHDNDRCSTGTGCGQCMKQMSAWSVISFNVI